MFNNGCRRANGLTLIEMLLALTLSVILIGNLSALYVFVKKIYQRQSGLIYVEKNLRLLKGILTQEVHHSGIQGAKYFFVEKTSRVNQDGGAVYALYRKKRNHAKSEMIENIDLLKIHYDEVVDNRLVEVDEIDHSKEIAGVSFYSLLRDSMGLVKKSGYLYVAITKKRNRVNHGVSHGSSDDVD